MKALFILIFLSLLTSCHGQEAKNNTSIADSIGLISRNKADMLLSKLDTIEGMKMIYSLKGEHYYLSAKDGNSISEFYFKLDDNNEIQVSRRLDSTNNTLLDNAFDVSKYHEDFITSMPDAKYVRGHLSYFVIKDIQGKRYGEYSLSALTLPSPLSAELFAYVNKKLISNITEEGRN